MRYRDRERERFHRDQRNSQHQERGDRRHRFRRRRRRDSSRRAPEERRDYPPCPVCERPVSELSSAICHAETLKPAHFECIMKKIEAAEGLGANERICYLGKGSFGILRFQKMGGSIPFIIRKRIQYENLEETPDWRRQLDRFSPREKPKPSPEQPP